MAELLLIVSLLAVFVFGFYLISRLDRFLEGNRKALLKENESCEPSAKSCCRMDCPKVKYYVRSAVFVKRTEMSILFFPIGRRMIFRLR